MPELPDLEIICRVLANRVIGQTVVSAQAGRPIIVRNLLGGDVGDHLVGRCLAAVSRRAKSVILALDGGINLVIQPMLAGRIRYGLPLKRDRKRDALVLGLNSGHELRYHDAKDMGRIYLTDDLAQVPTLLHLGPEATAAELTLDAFGQRLSGRHGEIKRILTDQTFVAGIGNAYADEILWHTHLYPFCRRADLSAEQIAALYTAMRYVLFQAIDTLSERMGEQIDVEVRDHLAVHGRAGQPCPRCGATISEVQYERQATHFCRACQPGTLVRQS